MEFYNMDVDAGTASEVAGAQSVERATALLMLVARFRRAGAGLGEIVTESGLKQPTARRLLLALMRTGLVEQDPVTRRYLLGPSCYVLGLLASDGFGIHHHAIDSLVRMAVQSQDTAFLTVRSGTYGVCLHREEGTYPIRSHVLAAGDRHPLMVSAGNLAMLACMPDREVDFILETHAEACAERYPRLVASTVREVLVEARAQGYAVNRGLTFPGSWGLGVAIKGYDGEPIAALSIAAIEGRLGEERQKTLAQMLLREAREIETRMRTMVGARHK